MGWIERIGPFGVPVIGPFFGVGMVVCPVGGRPVTHDALMFAGLAVERDKARVGGLVGLWIVAPAQHLVWVAVSVDAGISGFMVTITAFRCPA